MSISDISSALNFFEECLVTPEQFAQPQDDKAESFRFVTKELYNLAQETDDSKEISCQALPRLITRNFDDEQIWQQLELKNAPVTTYFNKNVKSLLQNNDVSFYVKRYVSQNHLIAEQTDEDGGDHLSDYSYGGSNNESSEEQNMDNKSQKKLDQRAKLRYSSEVDDQFFKLSQLEEFLQYEDLREEKGQDNDASDESDVDLFADIPSEDELFSGGKDESDSDLFADIPSEDELVGDGKATNARFSPKGKSAGEAMYQDFFPHPYQSEDEHSSDEREHVTKSMQKKSVRFSQNLEDRGKLPLLDCSDDDDSIGDSKQEKQAPKTSFEQQQEKERKRIEELEKSMLAKKPWQFTGEVDAGGRPRDSLLHQQVEYDSNLKSDFVSTDEITDRVENIIKMAITNKAWCDVELKVRPVEDDSSYKPLEEVDQSKSKQSLAELYEEEYLKKFEKGGEKENPQHVAIREMMESVTNTLTEFFSFMPKQPVREIKIVSNMPAITVEEVAPTTVSDAAMLAPEEIKPKSGLPIGKTERTETDKKRERRKKKKLQKFRGLEKEKREQEKAAVSKKAATKLAKREALKKLKQQRNVTVVEEKKNKKKRKF